MFCSLPPQQQQEEGILLTILPALEKMAHSYFERCTRAYRGIIIGHMPTIRNIDHARRLSKDASVFREIYKYLPHVYTASTQNIFEMVHSSTVPAYLMDIIWYITQIITLHPLPSCLIQKQLDALSKRYHGDTTCIQQCRKLHVCVQCVIRKGSAHAMQLRHNCETGELICMQCGAGSVLVLDMLGCIATIGTDVLVLSSCCGSFIHYKGTGHEFSVVCGVQCVNHVQLSRRGARKQRSQPHITPPSCIMCRQRNTVQNFQLLDIHTRRVVPYFVCSRHRVPAHILKHIKDKKTLDLFYQIQKTSSSSSALKHHHQPRHHHPH